jgi:large subunit ribosomal protein L32
MPVPKRKRSHSRIAKAHANKRYKVKSFTECKNCKAVICPHQVCSECGHYKGIKVLKTKMERALARGEARKAKEARKKEAQGSTVAPEQE